MEKNPETVWARWRRRVVGSRVGPLVVVLLLVLPAVAWKFLPRLSRSSDGDLPMLYVVQLGDFTHDIIERGAVESASNTEVRCEVQAQNSAGTRILEVVPEGTYVKGPVRDEKGKIIKQGDLICRLDSSAFENDELKQKSVVENASAAMIQAKSDHDNAIKAYDEYEWGKYKIDKAQIEADLAVAEEYERRATDTVRYSKQLLEKGYITKLQLEADEFAAAKTKTDREAAKLKETVLEKYTKEKMKVQLTADIKSTEAKLRAQENTWKLEKKRLDLIEEQIAKCTIRAPANGQVVYANNTERMGGSEIIIEEGALVRERQVIARLPDPQRMQVKAKINESKIALVKTDQPATIRLDALPDQELVGVVRKVNEYPTQSGWWSANIKEYETTVEIVGSPAGLKTGLNAEVRIRVAQMPSVVQVPVQAVFEHGEKHYCFVRRGDDWELRELEIGDTNDKTIVIRENLQPGETVALNAASFREEFDLPEAPAEPQAKVMLASAEKPASGVRPAPAPGHSAGPPAAGRPAPGGEKTRAGPPGKRQAGPVVLANLSFQQLDKDGDGRLGKEDLPESLRPEFAMIDANHDGFIDRTEWAAAVRRLAARDDRKPRVGGG
jgi:multidrug resistance efflux pump